MDGVMQAPSGPSEDVDKGFKFGGSAPLVCGEEFHRFILSKKYDLLLGRKTYEISRAIGHTRSGRTRPPVASQRSSTRSGSAWFRGRARSTRVGRARCSGRRSCAISRGPKSSHDRDGRLHREALRSTRAKAVARAASAAAQAKRSMVMLVIECESVSVGPTLNHGPQPSGATSSFARASSAIDP